MLQREVSTLLCRGRIVAIFSLLLTATGCCGKRDYRIKCCGSINACQRHLLEVVIRFQGQSPLFRSRCCCKWIIPG